MKRTALFLLLLAILSVGCASSRQQVSQPAVPPPHEAVTQAKLSSAKIGPSFAVYSANADLHQVEFANAVEESIVLAGGEVYDRTAVATPKEEPELDEAVLTAKAESPAEGVGAQGQRTRGVALVPIAISLAKNAYSSYQSGKSEEEKEKKEALAKTVSTIDPSSNPSDYAIFTYSTDPSSGNEGRIRIVDKKTGKVVVNKKLKVDDVGRKGFTDTISKVFNVKYLRLD
jgi:uncharacterized FlaG/YvyC family protein